MKAGPGSFSVCATVRESVETLVRFANHYRALGACEVLLFYDGTPPSDARLRADDIRLVACDAAYWASRPEGTRPAALEAVQAACYRHALAEARGAWLFLADSDEFLTGPRPVAAMLADLPAEVEALRVPTVEAVWGPGDDPAIAFGCTHFRTPMKRRLAWPLTRLLYGRARVFYRAGLVGHHAGKHFLRRTAQEVTPGLHTSFRSGADLGVWAARLGPVAHGFRVAHFDAISFARWSEKWRRRIKAETDVTDMHPIRAAQQAMIARAWAAGETERYRLFITLYTLSRPQKLTLRAAGHLLRADIFPKPD